MTQAADSIRFIGEADVLRIMNRPRSTMRYWVKKGLLIEPPDGRFREVHAVEAVAVSAIVAAVGVDDAQIVWPHAKAEVRKLALGPRESVPDQLDIVFDTRWGTIAVASNNEEVGALVRRGWPFVVIPIRDQLKAARDAFWNYAQRQRATEDGRRRGAERTRRREQSEGRRGA